MMAAIVANDDNCRMSQNCRPAVSCGLGAPVAALLLLAAAAPAAAERPDLAGEKILADFARCAVRGAPNDARALLRTVPGAPAEGELLGKFGRKRMRCMDLGHVSGPTQFRLDAQAMRGAIAKRLYLDLKSGAPWGPTHISASPDHAVPGPVGYSVVHCAVARAPEAADMLVRAPRLSQEEAAASAALAPALNACARGRGRLDISGTAIHGWAAEALYKLRSSNASKVL